MYADLADVYTIGQHVCFVEFHDTSNYRVSKNVSVLKHSDTLDKQNRQLLVQQYLSSITKPDV